MVFFHIEKPWYKDSSYLHVVPTCKEVVSVNPWLESESGEDRWS